MALASLICLGCGPSIDTRTAGRAPKGLPAIDSGAGDGGAAGGGTAVDSGGSDGVVGDSGGAADGGGSGGGGSDAGSSDGGGPDTGAPPLPAPLRVVVISDMNDSYGSTTYGSAVHGAVDVILDDPPDLVIATGDLVAGQRSGLDYAAMWAGFHSAVSDRLAGAGVPFVITPGNHDASGYAGYEAERAIFADQWAARRPALDFVDGDDWPLRYSFLMGEVLFVSLDATIVGSLGAEQRAWLDGALATPARARVVYGHLPLAPVAQGRETEALFDAALEAILIDHGVDLYIAGHHHAYYPGRTAGLRQASVGCLGSGPRALIGEASTAPRSLLRLDFEGGELLSLEGWEGARYDALIPRSSLPARLGSGASAVVRDDL